MSLKKLKTFIASALMSLALISPTLALADYQTLSIIGNPLTALTAPYLMLTGLTGQSACTISVLAPFAGSISVEGLYNNTTNAQWTAPLTVYSQTVLSQSVRRSLLPVATSSTAATWPQLEQTAP